MSLEGEPVVNERTGSNSSESPIAAPVDLLAEFRNSEGLTPAESWRNDAERIEREADALARDASMRRSSAFNYRRMADQWEREHLGRQWADLRAGDVITLRVHDMQEGWQRERREVVAVNWPVITLRRGGGITEAVEYDFDASSDPDRDIRLVVE